MLEAFGYFVLTFVVCSSAPVQQRNQTDPKSNIHTISWNQMPPSSSRLDKDGKRSCCPPECMDWGHIDGWLNVHGMCPPGPPSMPLPPPPAQPPPPCRPPVWTGPTAPPRFLDAGTTCIDLYPTQPPPTIKIVLPAAPPCPPLPPPPSPPAPHPSPPPPKTSPPPPCPIILQAEVLKKKLKEAGVLDEDEDKDDKKVDNNKEGGDHDKEDKDDKDDKEDKDDKTENKNKNTNDKGNDNDDPLNLKNCSPQLTKPSCGCQNKDDDDDADNPLHKPPCLPEPEPGAPVSAPVSTPVSAPAAAQQPLMLAVPCNPEQPAALGVSSLSLPCGGIGGASASGGVSCSVPCRMSSPCPESVVHHIHHHHVYHHTCHNNCCNSCCNRLHHHWHHHRHHHACVPCSCIHDDNKH